MNLAVCTVCQKERPFTAENFARHRNQLRRQCNPCRAKYRRERRKNFETPERRDRRLKTAREYSKVHAERLKPIAKSYRVENAERLVSYFRNHYQKNKDKKKEQARQWRIGNPEQKAAANRRWAVSNPEKMKGIWCRSKTKRRADSSIRLSESISAQIRSSLKGAKDGRSWEMLVGYSRGELAWHLERQFTAGMSWKNYGEWHVDHILPLVSFKYEKHDDPDFKACWALTNLRPLWADENIRKKDKRFHLV